MKNIKSKIFKNFIFVAALVLVFAIQNNINATSYGISNTNLTVGATATISINGTGYAGKYTISTSNSSVVGVSETSKFVDNQIENIILTAKSVGSSTITVTPADVSSYANPEEAFTKSQSFTVNVSNPSTNVQNTNNSGSSSTSNNSQSNKSGNANLRTLVPEIEGLTPSFSPNITNYTLIVPSTVTKLNMSVGVEQSGAKYWISGDENLQIGNNTVTITVTAPNGTKKTYTIVVTKAEDTQKANALLNSLVIEGYELSPEFSSEVFEYDIGKIESNVKKLNILTFTSSDKAKVEIQGNDELKDGENTVKIIVTAEDETTKKEYVIKYNKEASTVENLTDETNALEDTNNSVEGMSSSQNSNFWQIIKNNSLVLLMYLVILVEFVQIVYLYKELKKRDLQLETSEDGFENLGLNSGIETLTEENESSENSTLDSKIDEVTSLENDVEIKKNVESIWDVDKPDFSQELSEDLENENSAHVRGGRSKKNK